MTAIDRTLTQPGTQVVLAARGLEVTFGQTHALRGVDLDIAAGEVLAIMGAIGFGKIDAAQSDFGHDRGFRGHNRD